MRLPAVLVAPVALLIVVIGCGYNARPSSHPRHDSGAQRAAIGCLDGAS
jgi:hypothetical protein